MDTLESRLREQFNRPVEPGDAVAGIAGAHRIRRRRTAWHAALGTVAAAGVAVAVVAGITLNAPAPEQPAAPVPAVIDWGNRDAAHSTEPGLYGFRFVDAYTGYAEQRVCAPPCGPRLRRTDDGGRTWQPVHLTGFATIDPNGGVVKVFDADHVVLTSLTTDDKTVNNAGFATADGGRTWSPIARQPIGTVARPPAGTLFMPVAAHADGPNREAALYPDGHLDIVTSMPSGLSGGGRPTDVPVYAYGDGDQRVWVSVDQSATWRQAAMPVDLAHRTVTVLGGVGGPQYAYVAPDAIGAAGEVLVSTDRGVTWTAIAAPARTPVIVPSGGQEDGQVYDTTSAVLAPDGAVLLNDGARTWRLAPGSTVFTPYDQRFPIISLEQVGPNVVAISADVRRTDPTITKWLTTDGRHWTRVGW